MSLPTFSDVTDMFTFDSGTRQQSPEKVTPHKLSLLILIYEFKQLCAKEDDPNPLDLQNVLSAKDKRDFMIAMLDLLQCPDMELKTLRGHVEPVLKPILLQSLYECLRDISNKGIRPINDFFEKIATLLTGVERGNNVQRDSIVGIYIRRMELAYNEMSFSQIVDTHDKVMRYFDAEFGDYADEFTVEKLAAMARTKKSMLGLSQSSLSMSVLDEKSTLDSFSGQSFFSKKQAQYFIANQAHLLRHNEGKALPPDQLQERLTRILSSNPDMAEAHFLSYINNLRVKEYCTSLLNLYHYFDCKACIPSDGNANRRKTAGDEVASCYAALNLASLQFRFGNMDECKATLQEAIQKAQESNDQVCLQHGLMWMHLVDQGNVPSNQLERAIRKTRELALSELHVLGYNSLGQRLGQGLEKPCRVVHMHTESHLINCLHSNYNMMSSGFAHLASLWDHYGNRELCSLNSQIVLHLDTNINSIYYTGHSVCIALCHLALQFAHLGNYTSATEILNHAKLKFPAHTSYASIWQSVQQQINFTRAVHNRRLNEADQILVDLIAVDEEEASIRKPILLREKGETTKALDILNELLKECDDAKNSLNADRKCKILLQVADLYLASDSPSSAALYITDCIALAKQHFLDTTVALATVYLAFVQLCLKMPGQAARLIESQLTKILTNATSYNKARVLYLYAKCKAANTTATCHSSSHRRAELISSLDLLSTAIGLFNDVEAHMREKDALYLQSVIYHQLGNMENRNKCAYQFKKLDKLYPTLNASCLNAL